MNTFEYAITKIINIPYTCPKCEGSGSISKSFRKTVFVHTCHVCGGEGRLFHTIRKEVPFLEELKEDRNLIEAIKALNIIQ